MAAVLAGVAVFVVLAGIVGWYLWGVKVTIKTEPAESKIAIDGKEVGTSNGFGILTVSHISAGQHVLNVKHGRFEDYVLGRLKPAMGNEMLCKVICHNLCVLITSIYELGVEPELA